ncbi:MAG: hypothetical protein M3332_15770, partial [Actinomycetota bacterium]|nr:hypothetical protein [Actinomycetota bacterium]
TVVVVPLDDLLDAAISLRRGADLRPSFHNRPGHDALPAGRRAVKSLDVVFRGERVIFCSC